MLDRPGWVTGVTSPIIQSRVARPTLAGRQRHLREALTPHDLRGTAASLAVAAGANVKVVSACSGMPRPP